MTGLPAFYFIFLVIWCVCVCSVVHLTELKRKRASLVILDLSLDITPGFKSPGLSECIQFIFFRVYLSGAC